jgi:hypothetical protein
MLIPFGHSVGIEAATVAGSLPKGLVMDDSRTLQIRELNDTFRTSLAGGKAFFTQGVSARGVAFSAAALASVRTSSEFTVDSDVYGEHDFGSVIVAGEKLFWKIDYYDLSLNYGSQDPADPAQTTRVLTIMLAEEY